MDAITIILLILIVIAVGYILLMHFGGDRFQTNGNSITSKVERKQRIEGEIEVLKKEQAVKVEETIRAYEVKKNSELDTIIAQINANKAQIKNLEKAKEDKAEMLDQEKKIEIDRVINFYNRKITSKQNQAKKLNYYIGAEQKNIDDVIDPIQPNAPEEKKKTKQILLEEVVGTDIKSKKVSKEENK